MLITLPVRDRLDEEPMPKLDREHAPDDLGIVAFALPMVREQHLHALAIEERSLFACGREQLTAHKFFKLRGAAQHVIVTQQSLAVRGARSKCFS